jgi:hypothetical protein
LAGDRSPANSNRQGEGLDVRQLVVRANRQDRDVGHLSVAALEEFLLEGQLATVDEAGRLHLSDRAHKLARVAFGGRRPL